MKPINMSLNSKVLEVAGGVGVTTSQAVGELYCPEVPRRYWERWNSANQEAVTAYNTRIDCEELPLAQYRSF